MKLNMGRSTFRVLGARLIAIGLVAVLLAWGFNATNRAEAHFPHPGIDFSIGVGTQCDSTVSPAKCNVPLGQPFTVQFKLNSIPSGFTYTGYSSVIEYSGVIPIQSSLVQTGAGVWPTCVIAVPVFSTGQVAPSCAYGPYSGPSSYTGVMYHIDFQCPSIPAASPATISLANGPGAFNTLNTSLVDSAATEDHGEATGTETLTINCVSTVGGISLDPEAGVLPLAQPSRSSGPDAGLLAESIAGSVTTAVVLGGAGWYARRRRVRS